MENLLQVVVDELNRLLFVDRQAISRLFHSAVPCNDSLELDSRCVVGGPADMPELRCLGVLNSIMVACCANGKIAMEVQEQTRTIVRFVAVTPETGTTSA